MTKSMTEGRPLTLMLRFAFPLLLGNLFQQFYNMVDTAIVGQTLGADALGSVGASSSVMFLILGFCIGLTAGFAIPVAQTFGAGNESLLRSYVFHAWILTAVCAVVLTTGCALLCTSILRLLQTPEELMADAWAYLFVIFLGIPGTLLYNLCSGLLRAVGDSKTPFLFLAFSAVLNIGLDILFIRGFGWGTGGAALATILSQGFSGILCFAFIRRHFELLRIRRSDVRWRWHTAGSLLLMGLPMGLQYSITAIGSMVMQGANNSLGAMYTSAFAAATKIKQLMMCPFDAIATACATFCSQNYGAGKIRRVEKGLREGILTGAVYGLLAGVILFLFGRTLATLFVSASYTEILDAAQQFLTMEAYFFWVLGLLNVTRQCLQAIGYSGRAIFSGVTEMIARTLIGTFAVPVLGFTAICLADPVAWICGTVYCAVMMHICLNIVRRTHA